jgi:hypothetical protein
MLPRENRPSTSLVSKVYLMAAFELRKYFTAPLSFTLFVCVCVCVCLSVCAQRKLFRFSFLNLKHVSILSSNNIHQGFTNYIVACVAAAM